MLPTSSDASNGGTRRNQCLESAAARALPRSVPLDAAGPRFRRALANLYRGGKITGGVFIGRGRRHSAWRPGWRCARAISSRPSSAIRPGASRSVNRCSKSRAPILVRDGPMRGRDGNIHRGYPKAGLLAMISHLGAMIPMVVGGFLAKRRFRGETGAVGAACIGEGATSTGAFHEGLNLAAVEKLPLVLVVANNQYAVLDTQRPPVRLPRSRGQGRRLRRRGVIPSMARISALVLKLLDDVVSRARSGRGPQMIVEPRWAAAFGGHGEHDDAHYVDPASSARARSDADCLRSR